MVQFGQRDLLEMLNTPFVILDLIFAVILTIYYAFNNISFGVFYSLLGIAAPALLFGILFFINQTRLAGVIPFPFKQLNIWASSALFFLGFLAFFSFALIKIFQYLLRPYALYTQQAFAAYAAFGTPQTKVINLGYIQPIIEEQFWVVVVLAGFLLAYFVLKGLDLNPKSFTGKGVMWLVALAIGAVTFAGFHKFNPDIYKSLGDFLNAAGFRVLVILLAFGLGIMEFFIGAHIGNNMGSIVTCADTIAKTTTCNGTEIFLTGLFTNPLGIMLFIYIFLIRFGIALYGIVYGKFKWGDLIKPN